MSKLPFVSIADRLEFTTFEREFFIDSLFEAPVLDLDSNTLILNLELKRALPFSLYTRLNEKMEERLKAKVRLVIKVTETDLETKDNIAYILYILANHLSEELIKQILITVEDDAVIFLVENDDIQDKLLSVINAFSNDLSHCGLMLTCLVKQREKIQQGTADEVQVTIEKKTAPVQTNYKRKNMNETPIVAISDLYEGQRDVRIRGRIFNIESQMVKGNTVQRLTIYVHDESDAITFTVFNDKEEDRLKYAKLAIGQHIYLFGDVKSDSKSELIFSLKKFEEIEDWMFEELKEKGSYTARSLLNLSNIDQVKRTDL